MSTSDRLAAIERRLDAYRRDPRIRLGALALGIGLGALLALEHWAGLFVGGAIAGLGQRTVPRGIGAGALAGLGVWVVSLVTLQTDAAAVAALGSMPIIAISLGVAIGFGLLGGLLRGVL